MSRTIGIVHVDKSGNPTSSFQYSFKCYEPVQIGDYVLLDNAGGLSLGKVVNLNPSEAKAIKSIICKVNLRPYQDTCQIEKALKDIKDKMDVRKKELESTAIFDLLASIDSDMAKLVLQYKQLEQYLK
jgi:hypothetical protein